MNNWPTWLGDLDYFKMNDTFTVGNHLCIKISKKKMVGQGFIKRAKVIDQKYLFSLLQALMLINDID